MKQAKVISESKLALWRSAIAIAYADGTLNDSERQLLLSNLPLAILSEEQRKIIDMDLAEGVKLEDVFSAITDMRDRAHLINFARILVHADGQVNADEQDAINYISSYHSKKLDTSISLAAAKLEAKSLNDQYKSQLRKERYEDGRFVEDIFDFFAE